MRADGRGVIATCSQCGKANRLAYESLGQPARCGACQTPLSPPGEPVEAATAADFDALIGRSRLPVLVDFWAAWCGPCRMVAPEIIKVAKRQQGHWLVVKVDTEAVPELSTRLGIRSIPTLAVFAGGREKMRTAGAMNADQIEAFARQAKNPQ